MLEKRKEPSKVKGFHLNFIAACIPDMYFGVQNPTDLYGRGWL